MQNRRAMTIAAALAAILASLGESASAHDRLIAVIPPEIGVPPLGPSGLFPYRCSVGPVYNFYHDALYSQPPAVHLGYAYRPYYRYAAWRKVPRTHKCGELR
jgi:hypothetical protein